MDGDDESGKKKRAREQLLLLRRCRILRLRRASTKSAEEDSAKVVMEERYRAEAGTTDGPLLNEVRSRSLKDRKQVTRDGMAHA